MAAITVQVPATEAKVFEIVENPDGTFYIWLGQQIIDRETTQQISLLITEALNPVVEEEDEPATEG